MSGAGATRRILSVWLTLVELQETTDVWLRLCMGLRYVASARDGGCTHGTARVPAQLSPCVATPRLAVGSEACWATPHHRTQIAAAGDALIQQRGVQGIGAALSRQDLPLSYQPVPQQPWCELLHT
jgi:hypothetical protein